MQKSGVCSISYDSFVNISEYSNTEDPLKFYMLAGVLLNYLEKEIDFKQLTDDDRNKLLEM